MADTLHLLGYHRARHQLSLRFAVDQLRFATTYWYADLDLPALETRFGAPLLERIYFHIAAFEANKLCSLRPRRLDPGPFARYWTPRFDETWRAVLHQVWAQWRYQHDLPGYAGPGPISGFAPPNGEAVGLDAGAVETLSFCGGGKDSLVAMKLLEGGGIAYDSLAYASSIYGRTAPQHALIDGLLDHGSPRHRRRMWIYDDFLDSPVVTLHPELGIRTLLAGETPSALFAALPLALAHGYRQLVVGHERSADFGNLTWARTGETVNHQWGKSLAAERLLADHVRRHLIADLDYFSLLKPIDDVLIFNLLAEHPRAIPATHSCNEAKPWCRRCAKCAYVWLSYRAYLPAEPVAGLFGENLLEVKANRQHFRQMLGLEAHTPFECIGTVDEARLAFALCRRRGLSGPTAEALAAELPACDVEAELRRFLRVDRDHHAMPRAVLERILPQLAAGAAAARQRLLTPVA